VEAEKGQMWQPYENDGIVTVVNGHYVPNLEVIKNTWPEEPWAAYVAPANRPPANWQYNFDNWTQIDPGTPPMSYYYNHFIGWGHAGAW
jgi:hypothetical protein